MTTEFDRYAIQRTIKPYSDDLLSGHNPPPGWTPALQQTAISRAQSLLTDWEYLERTVIAPLRAQVRDAQRRLDAQKTT